MTVAENDVDFFVMPEAGGVVVVPAERIRT
jgi:hypothetical protein